MKYYITVMHEMFYIRNSQTTKEELLIALLCCTFQKTFFMNAYKVPWIIAKKIITDFYE